MATHPHEQLAMKLLQNAERNYDGDPIFRRAADNALHLFAHLSPPYDADGDMDVPRMMTAAIAVGMLTMSARNDMTDVNRLADLLRELIEDNQLTCVPHPGPPCQCSTGRALRVLSALGKDPR